MRTRSTCKHEPHLMLADDRKSAIPQEFDMQNHSDDETLAFESLKMAMCGWSCKCLLTRLNFLLAGIVFTLVLYVLSETSLVFESISSFFTGREILESERESKSSKLFLESHYELGCLLGPMILFSICTLTYIQSYESTYCSSYHHNSAIKRRS